LPFLLLYFNDMIEIEKRPKPLFLDNQLRGLKTAVAFCFFVAFHAENFAILKRVSSTCLLRDNVVSLPLLPLDVVLGI